MTNPPQAKYVVLNADGSPVDPGAQYLVLRIDGKAQWSAEVKALAQYLRACDPELAAHLRRFYGRGDV